MFIFIFIFGLPLVSSHIFDNPLRNEIKLPYVIHPNAIPHQPPDIHKSPPANFKGFELDKCLQPAFLNDNSIDCQRRRRAFFLSPVWRQRLGLTTLSAWRTHYGFQPISVDADPTTRTTLGFLRDFGPDPRAFFFLPPAQKLKGAQRGLVQQYNRSLDYEFFPASNSSLTSYSSSNITGVLLYHLDSPSNPPRHQPLEVQISVSRIPAGTTSELEQTTRPLPVSDTSSVSVSGTQAAALDSSFHLQPTGLPSSDLSPRHPSPGVSHDQSSGPQPSNASPSNGSGNASSNLSGSSRATRTPHQREPLVQLREGTVSPSLHSVPRTSSGVRQANDYPGKPLSASRTHDVHHVERSIRNATASEEVFRPVASALKLNISNSFRTFQAYDCSDPQETTAVRSNHFFECPITPDPNLTHNITNITLTVLQTTGFYQTSAFRLTRIKTQIPMYCTTHSHQTMAIELLSVGVPLIISKDDMTKLARTHVFSPIPTENVTILHNSTKVISYTKYGYTNALSNDYNCQGGSVYFKAKNHQDVREHPGILLYTAERYVFQEIPIAISESGQVTDLDKKVALDCDKPDIYIKFPSYCTSHYQDTYFIKKPQFDCHIQSQVAALKAGTSLCSVKRRKKV